MKNNLDKINKEWSKLVSMKGDTLEERIQIYSIIEHIPRLMREVEELRNKLK